MFGAYVCIDELSWLNMDVQVLCRSFTYFTRFNVEKEYM